MIKAITFDLNGVYFPDGKANSLQALGKLGIPEEEIKHVFIASCSLFKRLELSSHLLSPYNTLS